MNKQDIEQWLIDYKIKKYTIRPNLVVDVDGDVNLFNRGLEQLPFRFGHVTGGFFCSNNNLTSLKNCPVTIRGTFSYFNNPFEVTRENEGSWIRAIGSHKDVYDHIKEKATPHMTTAYELKWEE